MFIRDFCKPAVTAVRILRLFNGSFVYTKYMLKHQHNFASRRMYTEMKEQAMISWQGMEEVFYDDLTLFHSAEFLNFYFFFRQGCTGPPQYQTVDPEHLKV